MRLALSQLLEAKDGLGRADEHLRRAELVVLALAQAKGAQELAAAIAMGALPLCAEERRPVRFCTRLAVREQYDTCGQVEAAVTRKRKKHLSYSLHAQERVTYEAPRTRARVAYRR